MTINERIKLAIKWLIGQRVADNQEEVGKLLGYSNKSSFSQVINGKVPLPNDFIERLCSLNKNINKVWIIEEKGEMIYPQKTLITNTDLDKASSTKGIPYYDVDVTMGYDELPNDQTNIPNYYLHIPAFQNCDCAVPAYGRSMIPDINDGSIIAIKEVGLDSVLPGEAYLIITDDYRTVKYIRNCKDNPNKWRLVPKNLEEFDEMVIDKAKILRVFLVKGVITNKIL